MLQLAAEMYHYKIFEYLMNEQEEIFYKLIEAEDLSGENIMHYIARSRKDDPHILCEILNKIGIVKTTDLIEMTNSRKYRQMFASTEKYYLRPEYLARNAEPKPNDNIANKMGQIRKHCSQYKYNNMVQPPPAQWNNNNNQYHGEEKIHCMSLAKKKKPIPYTPESTPYTSEYQYDEKSEQYTATDQSHKPSSSSSIHGGRYRAFHGQYNNNDKNNKNNNNFQPSSVYNESLYEDDDEKSKQYQNSTTIHGGRSSSGYGFYECNNNNNNNNNNHPSIFNNHNGDHKDKNKNNNLTIPSVGSSSTSIPDKRIEWKTGKPYRVKDCFGPPTRVPIPPTNKKDDHDMSLTTSERDYLEIQDPHDVPEYWADTNPHNGSIIPSYYKFHHWINRKLKADIKIPAATLCRILNNGYGTHEKFATLFDEANLITAQDWQEIHSKLSNDTTLSQQTKHWMVSTANRYHVEGAIKFLMQHAKWAINDKQTAKQIVKLWQQNETILTKFNLR